MLKKIFTPLLNFIRTSSARPDFSFPEEYAAPLRNYDEYWKKRKPAAQTPRRDRLISGIIRNGSSVLDIGCGDGRLIGYLKENNSLKEAFGTDISDEALKKASAKGIECFKMNAESPDFSPGKRYDYIIVSEVLEHLCEPEILMKRIRSSFNEALIVTIPNTGYAAHRLRLLTGRFPVEWASHPSEHLRFWTRRDFRDWTSALGYKIIRTLAGDGLPVIAEIMPGAFASQLVFVLKRQ